jgi:hypothetical protein
MLTLETSVETLPFSTTAAPVFRTVLVELATPYLVSLMKFQPKIALSQLAARASGPPLATIPPRRLASAQMPMAHEERPIAANPTLKICSSTLPSVRATFLVFAAV